MAGDGIEPPTQGFSVPRSTTELPGHKNEVKSIKRGAIILTGFKCVKICEAYTIRYLLHAIFSAKRQAPKDVF